MNYLDRALKESKEPNPKLRDYIGQKCRPLVDAYDMRYRKEKALSDTLEALRHTDSGTEAEKAAKKIARLKGLLAPDHLAELRHLAEKGEWMVRYGAAYALAELRDEKSKPIFISLMLTRDPVLVDAAVHGMALMGRDFKDTYGDVLRILLKNEDDSIVSAAVRGLAAVGDIAGVRWLMFHAKKDGNMVKKRQMVDSVGKALATLAAQNRKRAEEVMRLIKNFRQGEWYAEQQKKNSLMYSVMEEHLAHAQGVALRRLGRA